MKTYKRKPLEVQAVQWTGNNFEEVRDFAISFKDSTLDMGVVAMDYSIGLSNNKTIFIDVVSDNRLLLTNKVLNIGCWIIKDDNLLLLLTDSQFKDKFEPAF